MQAARTLLLPMLDCVRPMHQISVPGRSSAMVLATSLHLIGRHARHALRLLGCPGLDLLANLVEAPDAPGDVVLVLPAVGQDLAQHAPQEGDVGAGADAHVFVGMRRRAREARIDHDQLGAALLGVQQVQHRHGMRLGRIAAEQEDRLGVVDVVEAIGHRPVAEGAGDAGNRGGVADARLVVAVVGPPHRHELAMQVGGLVGELGRSAPEDAVRPALLAQLQELVADLVDGLVPADARPFAGGELHGYFSRRSPWASSRVAAPLAQCVPMLIGLSKTGSWPVHTPFFTSAQMAQPIEQSGQIVFRRSFHEDAWAGACAHARR